jgi:broad specificity phosphatase PhoE
VGGQVFIIRHGETEWSAAGRHTGRTDLSLTEIGREQGKALVKLIAGRRFDLVLTSPLRRAHETCELAGLGGQARVEPDLAEWDYGEFEGLTTKEIRERIPNWSIWTHPPQQGERLDDLAERVDRVIQSVRAVDGDVALFGHGHALRVLTVRWLDLNPIVGSGFELDTGAIGVLGWSREFPALIRWNLTAISMFFNPAC